MTSKILSDFDGVWTDQVLEARGVRDFMIAEAARLAGIPSNDAVEDFDRFEAAIRAEPARHGWAPDGRVTAYVDEDPFCVGNAISAWIARSDGERETRYRQGVVESGFDTMNAFADHCFFTATGHYRTMHPPALVPDARETFERLVEVGAELVVVSNSKPAKLIDWFRSSGIDAGESAGHALRVRGSAAKFVLGESDRSITVAGREIFVDRPSYRAILTEEAPDLVIGDVFSLDLALPHVMREEGAPGAPRELVLRRHRHTPGWVAEGRADGAIDHLVSGVAELVERITGARA